MRSTIEIDRCQSSFAHCEAEFDLGKGKNRSKASYPHRNDTNPNSHEYDRYTSRRVKVKSTFGGPPPIDNHMRRSSASVHGRACHGTQLICSDRLRAFSWVEAQCCRWQWVAEQRSKALAQSIALVDGEASVRRSKKTFGPQGRVHAYGKDSTKRRQL